MTFFYWLFWGGGANAIGFVWFYCYDHRAVFRILLLMSDGSVYHVDHLTRDRVTWMLCWISTCVSMFCCLTVATSHLGARGGLWCLIGTLPGYSFSFLVIDSYCFDFVLFFREGNYDPRLDGLVPSNSFLRIKITYWYDGIVFEFRSLLITHSRLSVGIPS